MAHPIYQWKWVTPLVKIPPAETNKKDTTNRDDSITGGSTDPTFKLINSTLNANSDKMVTTEFLNDASERIYEPFPIEPVNVNKRFDGLGHIDRSDIIKILSTPINIRTFNFTSASAANTTLDSFFLPFDATNAGTGTDAGQGMWITRLNAFQGFRATAVLDFQVNVNRFAQGRLLIHFIPGQILSTSDTIVHRFNLMTKSQNPNVQINVNRDTITRLRLPYVSAWPAYDLTFSNYGNTLSTTAGVMGQVFCVVYSPLIGTTTVPVNVWLHFEDVELMNPTYTTIPNAIEGPTDVPPGIEPEMEAQSAPLECVAPYEGLYMVRGCFDDDSQSTISECSTLLEWEYYVNLRNPVFFKEDEDRYEPPDRYDNIIEMYEHLFKFLKYDDFLAEPRPGDFHWEPQARGGFDKKNVQDKEKNGVVSTILSRASDLAGSFKPIPLLSSYAGVAEWFLRSASGAAASFGWAKPESEATLTRVIMQNNPYLGVGDGEMASYKVGMSATNKLEQLIGFAGNDLDEMSFEYVSNRPAYIATFNWATSAPQGTELYTLDLGPKSLITNYTIAANNNIYTMTPFSFISSYFSHWRADMVVCLKIVKTEFHTGRLGVTFHVGLSSSPTANQECYLSREVLDLKESDTFVITVPYTSLVPFLSSTEVMGRLHVIVYNPLNAPSTVANNVNIIVEVSAKRVHFNGVSGYAFCPATGTNASWVPQSDTSEIELREKVITMPGLVPSDDYLEPSRYCCGEVALSFKSLLSRNCSNFYAISPTSGKIINWLAFTLGGVYESAGVYTYAPFAADLISGISCLYSLARGSIRYLVIDRNGNDGSISAYTANDNTSYLSMDWLSLNPLSMSNTVIPVTKTTNGASNVISVNQFGKTHSRNIDVTFGNAPRRMSLGEPATIVSYWSSNDLVVNNIAITRSAGDDFQLGYFIGVPVMYRTSGLGQI